MRFVFLKFNCTLLYPLLSFLNITELMGSLLLGRASDTAVDPDKCRLPMAVIYQYFRTLGLVWDESYVTIS